MNYDLTLLKQACEEYKISLTSEQEQQFIQYYELLTEWDRSRISWNPSENCISAFKGDAAGFLE